MTQPFEAYEMQPSNIPSDTGRDEDQRHQCWKDVEAETGFSTYTSFLEALAEAGPQFKNLVYFLRDRKYLEDFGDVFVLDILKDGSTSISWRVQGEKGLIPRLPRGLQASEASTQLLQHLRSPPENVQARIVLWSISRNCFPHPRIIDALGLGLRICPSFFATLLSILDPFFGLCIPDEQEHVKIGNSAAAVTRDYRFEGGVPPILLVAGEDDLNFRPPSGVVEEARSPYHEIIREVLSREISRRVLPCRSAIDKISQSNLESVSSNQYLNLVKEQVQDNNGIDAEGDGLLFMMLLPLFRLEVLCLSGRRQIVQLALLRGNRASITNKSVFRRFYGDFYQLLDEHRFWLRRETESLEESRNHFERYLHSQGAEQWLEGKVWINQEKNLEKAIAETRATEAEARDYMQLHIGDLSILESRKSIQLSNKQMDEAKRGKNHNL